MLIACRRQGERFAFSSDLVAEILEVNNHRAKLSVYLDLRVHPPVSLVCKLHNGLRGYYVLRSGGNLTFVLNGFVGTRVRLTDSMEFEVLNVDHDEVCLAIDRSLD